MTETKEKEIRATPEAAPEQPMLSMRLGRTDFLITLRTVQSPDNNFGTGNQCHQSAVKRPKPRLRGGAGIKRFGRIPGENGAVGKNHDCSRHSREHQRPNDRPQFAQRTRFVTRQAKTFRRSSLHTFIKSPNTLLRYATGCNNRIVVSLLRIKDCGFPFMFSNFLFFYSVSYPAEGRSRF